MGQFSWICSDTEKALLRYDIYKENIIKYTKRAFLLIPEEFGGGSFKVDNNYEGYGVFYDERGKEHDVYVEFARWNGIEAEDEEDLRIKGIELAFSDEYIKYPIKIVEIECPYREAKESESDPNQGWGEDEDE
jgi:hypothetical protein